MIRLEKDQTNRNLGMKPHTCRFCGTSGNMQSYLVREMMQNTRDEFEYFVCSECNTLQIGKVPEDLGKYYGEDYYSYRVCDEGELSFPEVKVSDYKILDVGCGKGKWLIEKAKEGYSDLYGCDPFIPETIHYDDRIKIYNTTIHEVAGDHSFDRIMMQDSFEHVTDPLEVLVSARRLLKPSGIIEMSIPTYPNIAFDLFGPHWYQIDAPRHITIPSLKGLNYLADKAGLRVLKTVYDADYSQILRSFFYQQGVPFFELTQELVDQCFTNKDKEDILNITKQSNINGNSDHMNVFLEPKND